jgi:hypothetical protein
MPFPKKTALERLLVTERHRRRCDEAAQAGFAVPAIVERAIDVALEPLAVTDARGRLVATKVSRSRGVARYGFSDCTTEEECALLPRFFDALWRMSEAHAWQNRCTSLAEVSAKMRHEPRSIVVSYGWIEQVSGMTREDADCVMGFNGYISKGEQQILVADFPEGQALVAASPPLLGIYTRIDERLGVLLTNVDQTVFLVRGAS